MLLQNDTWRLVMNRQVNENDRILFRNRIGIWQERCYEGLTEKYLRILTSRRKASERFRAVCREVENDAYAPSISLSLSRSNMDMNIMTLLSEGVITLSDLDGFSDDVLEKARFYLHMMETYSAKKAKD